MKSTGYVLKERAYVGGASPPDAFEDESRFGNNGTHTNITWVKEPSGLWVRSFAGNGYVSIADDPSFDIKTKLTALIWANTDDVVNTRFLLTKYGTTDNKREWQLDRQSTSGDVSVTFGDPNNGSLEGWEITDDDYLVNGTWVLAGFTFSSGTCIIYISGVAVNSTATNVPVSLYNDAADVKVGTDNDNAAGWKGYLALPRIYNRVLSDEQIAAIFQNERHFFGV